MTQQKLDTISKDSTVKWILKKSPIKNAERYIQLEIQRKCIKDIGSIFIYLSKDNLKTLLEGLKKKKTYVRIINQGKTFTTHPDAKKFGLTNYHFCIGLPHAKEGDVLKVVKEFEIQSGRMAYHLKDRNGVEYIVGADGCDILNFK